MTTWFDKRALQAGGLTPDQVRKVRSIQAALDRSARRIHDHQISINTFQKSALKAKTGRITPEWPRRLGGLRKEALAARDELGSLQTGLRAERTLRAALSELASAYGAWERGLSSSDQVIVTRAIASTQRHFTNAGRLGKSGLADLKVGR